MLKIGFVITAIKSHNVCIFNVRVDHVRVEDLADAVVLAACPLASVAGIFGERRTQAVGSHQSDNLNTKKYV